MTIPGLNEKPDDKEKLVIKNDYVTITPNGGQINKKHKRKYVLRLIAVLILFLLLLSTIFLIICYIKKIGPFKRIIRGRCLVGESKHGHRKIYETYEMSDDYELIDIPKVHAKFGLFKPVKTLHIFQKNLTIIHFNGICFVKPMLKEHFHPKNWYNSKFPHDNKNDGVPNNFNHMHWQISKRPNTHEYLRKHVHKMASTLCMFHPVIHLKIYNPNASHEKRSCHKKCENCKISDQLIKMEYINGENCKVCHCKIDEALKSSQNTDPNCKTIKCENKCTGNNSAICVHCRCADNDKKIIEIKRNKRYIKNECEVVAKIFEGYSPLDEFKKIPVDYIHNC